MNGAPPSETAGEPVITEAEERRYAELQTQALDLARAGETTLLESMVRAGLPVNLEDHKGDTLLMLACYHDQLETARMLLAHGAGVDRRNQRGQTPLGGVAFKGYAEIARLLLEHGAAVDADNGNGMTPLMFAGMFGRTEVAEVLRQAGANVRTRNRYGLTSGVLARTAFIWRTLMRLAKR
jgi:ankyrin repeat protein